MAPVALTVAHEKRAIPVRLGMPLAGIVSRRGRFAESVRDPVSVQVLDLRAGERRLTLALADLLVIPTPLHREVARLAAVPEDELVLAATHTHSSLGGYWDLGQRGELLMGSYRPQLAALVAGTLADAVRAARGRTGEPCTVTAAGAEVTGASLNRRETNGPVDPELVLARFTPATGTPIDLVCFGAHPALVVREDAEAVSADYPGALRRRLADRGVRALFLQGAVAGLDPAGTVASMAERLEAAWAEATSRLEPVAFDVLEVERRAVPMPAISCRVMPPAMPASGVLEPLLWPVRRYLLGMGRDALPPGATLPLPLLRLGALGFLFTPCDLGVGLALDLKQALRARGLRHAATVSHANGYFGYVHRRADYERAPDSGHRFIALYENAMSLGGWDLGEELLRRFTSR